METCLWAFANTRLALVIKIVLVEIYTRFSTTLVEPDRVEKRSWEGKDRMAEVKFEVITPREAEGIHGEIQATLPP